MKFNHRAVSAHWQEESSTWRVELETTDSLGKAITIVRECDVLVKGLGSLNNWKYPDIEGLSNFKGKLMHTANWDATVDLTGKRVAVIGNGASAVQCVAALQPGNVLQSFMLHATVKLLMQNDLVSCEKAFQLHAYGILDAASSLFRWSGSKRL